MSGRCNDELAAFANASSGDQTVAPDLQDHVRNARVEDAHRAIAKIMADAPSSVVIFGDVAAHAPNASALRAMAREFARLTGSAFNEVAPGANDVGLARAGAVPQSRGKNAAQMIAQPPKSLIVLSRRHRRRVPTAKRSTKRATAPISASTSARMPATA